MDRQGQDQRHPVTGQHAIHQLLGSLQLVSLIVHVFHGLPPSGAAERHRHQGSQRHDGAGGGLALHRHQQMSRPPVLLRVKFPHDIAAVLLVEPLRAMHSGDRLDVPLLHGIGHHRVAVPSEDEVHRVLRHPGMGDEELGGRIHISHGLFLTNISYSCHWTNIFSSFSNTIAREFQNANSLFIKK